jgi:hypothetical protein
LIVGRYTGYILILALWAGRLDGQLLFKPGEPYVNYAYESYRHYESVLFGKDRTPQFDNLGQFVMNGVSVFELQEFRTIRPVAGSIIRKPSLYGAYLNRLVIADDSYKGVNSRLIVGDRIRTKFTSLTLDLAAMNGIRLDTHYKGLSLVLLSSRVDRPIFEAEPQNSDNRIHGSETSEFRPRWSTYLLGGDLRSQLPGIDLGVSWVNQFRTDSFKKMSENSFKGTLPTTGRPPRWIVVRVSDHDIDDVAGVRLRRATLTVNGRQLQHTAGPYDKNAPEELALTITRHLEQPVIPPAGRDNSNDLVVAFPHEAPGPQGTYDVEGREALLLWFRVPAVLTETGDTTSVKSAFVDLDLAGDYKIEMAEVFNGASSNPASYFYTTATAKGRPDAPEVFRRVRSRYGRQTGRTLTSAHVNIDVKGLLLNAEYVRNFSFRAYPALISNDLSYFDDQSSAWFVNLRRDWNTFSLGGELFNMDSEYSTVLNVQDDDFRSYFQFLSSPFIYPTNFHEPRLPDLIENERAGPTNTIEFNTVDDNDDKDQFPDTYFLTKTINPETGGRFIADPDGIFPGLDSDLNGRPDLNENNNRVPDYYEPFLLYDVNPDAYDYGTDTNNNGIIDEREDDNKPDYPYDPDRRGFHGFGQAGLAKGVKLSLGLHHTRAPSAGRRAKVAYGRLEVEKRVPFWAEIHAIQRVKRVRDDIADDVFDLGREPIYFEPEVIPLFRPTEEELRNPLGEAELRRDPLLMRKSWVNTFYAKARLIRVEHLNIDLSFKWEHNNQADASFQDGNRISDQAIVFRADYLWNPWRNLLVKPQLKWMRQRLDDDESQVIGIDERFFYPILRLEYPLSSRTTLKLGAQGFPFFKSTYRNGLSPGVDFDSEVYLAQLSNTSIYLGYQVSVNLGYEVRKRTFLDEERRDQDIDYSRLFLRVIAGLRPLF